MDATATLLERHTEIRVQPFLAVDLGGTHARVALVRTTHQADGPIRVLAYREFRCAEFPGLPELLQAFLAQAVQVPVRRCVLACAGQLVGAEVAQDNLAWPVRLPTLRAALGFEDIAVLNDFEALGHALDCALARAGALLCGPDTHPAGPALVVGPGTGLGAAVRLPDREGGWVLTTEAGQMDFAPHTLRERAILAALAPRGGYVPYEQVLSGPGLLTVYRILCAADGVAPGIRAPEGVTSAAALGSDPHAVDAVAVFCAALGGFVGDLAMAYMATGGVYLAGGFLYAMFRLLRQSAFEERFLHGRSIRATLAEVPVRVIEHGRNGVLGAARWYARRLPPADVARGLAP